MFPVFEINDTVCDESLIETQYLQPQFEDTIISSRLDIKVSNFPLEISLYLYNA
jgi:hypothetical protein